MWARPPAPRGESRPRAARAARWAKVAKHDESGDPDFRQLEPDGGLAEADRSSSIGLKSRTYNLMTRLNSFCAMAVSASAKRNDRVLLNQTVLSDLANLGEPTSRRQRQEGTLTVYPVLTRWSRLCHCSGDVKRRHGCPSLNGQTSPLPPGSVHYSQRSQASLCGLEGKGETILSRRIGRDHSQFQRLRAKVRRPFPYIGPNPVAERPVVVNQTSDQTATARGGLEKVLM